MRALLIVACCLAASLGTMAQAQPALDLFDEAAYFLSLQYGGFADVPPQRLAPEIRQQLVKRCQSRAECPAEVGEEAIEALIAALDDPHTVYLMPEAFSSVRRLMGGGTQQHTGVGLQVAALEELRGLLVRRVLASGPAEAAGLQRGDVITAIDGDPLPTGARAAERLRQAEHEGTSILLTVERAPDERFTVELVSAPYPVHPRLEMLDSGIGLLDIPSFFSIEEIGPAVHELVQDARDEGARAFVIDLRNNPGGLLPESLVAAGAFVDEPARTFRSRQNAVEWFFRDGTLYVETENGQMFPQYDVIDPAFFEGPMAVLVHGGTASAAEFLAHDLQDAGALVVGEPTFGVADTGTGFIGLSNGGGLQITTGRILRSDGRTYAARVEPDMHIPEDLESLARGVDRPLAAAIDWLRQRPSWTRDE